MSANIWGGQIFKKQLAKLDALKESSTGKPTKNKIFGIFTEAGGWECTFRGRNVKGWDKKMDEKKKETYHASEGQTKVVLFLRRVPLFSVIYGVYTPESTSGHLIPPDLFLRDIRLDKFHNILAPTVRGEGDKTRSAPFHLPLPVSCGRRGAERGGERQDWS